MSNDRKLGTPTSDSSLEERIYKIEKEIFVKNISNFQGSTNAVLKNNLSVIPPPTNVSIRADVLGGFYISWSALRTPDVRYYEVEVANNIAFEHDESKGNFSKRYKAPQNEFLFTEAFDPDATWFVRIRTVLITGRKSNWSNISSTVTGRSVLITQEASIFDPFTDEGLFGPDVNTNPGFSGALDKVMAITPGYKRPTSNTAIYGDTDLIWNGGIVLLFSLFEFEIVNIILGSYTGLSSDFYVPNRVFIDLLRVHNLSDWETNGPVEHQNYEKIQSLLLNVTPSIGGKLETGVFVPVKLNRTVIPSFTAPDDVAASAPFIKQGQPIGYRTKITLNPDPIDSDNYIFLQPLQLQVHALELVR